MNLSNVSGMLFKKFKLFATKKCKNYGKKISGSYSSINRTRMLGGGVDIGPFI